MTTPQLTIGLLTTVLGISLGHSPSTRADNSFEIYTGYQSAPHSRVKGTDSDGNPFDFLVGWDGNSFDPPPYYGIRWTRWTGQVGWGIDFTHSKVYADDETLVKQGWKILEMTDGLNNLLVHRTHRYYDATSDSGYYAGVGLGVVVPHVEVQTDSASPKTFGYQYAGPSTGFNLGWRKEPKPEGGVGYFAEYKFTASWLDAELKNGGSLETRIFTNAFNLGLIF